MIFSRSSVETRREIILKSQTSLKPNQEAEFSLGHAWNGDNKFRLQCELSAGQI